MVKKPTSICSSFPLAPCIPSRPSTTTFGPLKWPLPRSWVVEIQPLQAARAINIDPVPQPLTRPPDDTNDCTKTCLLFHFWPPTDRLPYARQTCQSIIFVGPRLNPHSLCRPLLIVHPLLFLARQLSPQPPRCLRLMYCILAACPACFATFHTAS
ncbi:hypothetical protein LY78DRAFT_659618 [Colletotrichum sublineola]|nr:hypothetical protein LY78DRAFT_659618 [Colletotrichum sublineola]